MSSISDALRDLQHQFAVTLPARIATLSAQYQKLSLSDWQNTEVRVLQHQLHTEVSSRALPRVSPRLDRVPLIHLVEDGPVQAEHLYWWSSSCGNCRALWPFGNSFPSRR